MVNGKSLQKLDLLRLAVIQLGLDHQEIVRFIDKEVPAIEILPGYTESEGVSGEYNYISQYGCTLIWKTRGIT